MDNVMAMTTVDEARAALLFDSTPETVAAFEAAIRAEGLDVERLAWRAGWIACGSQMTTWTEEALMLEADRQYARLAEAER